MVQIRLDVSFRWQWKSNLTCFSFFFQQVTIVLHPSKIRHNGDKGTDVQQGPVQRFLFRLRPCVNLFYCLLLSHTLLALIMTKRDTGFIGELMIRHSKIDVTRAATNVFLGSMLSPQPLFHHARLTHVPGNSGLIIEGGTQPNICCKVWIPSGVFGVASLPLYASALNHVFGQ